MVIFKSASICYNLEPIAELVDDIVVSFTKCILYHSLYLTYLKSDRLVVRIWVFDLLFSEILSWL